MNEPPERSQEVDRLIADYLQAVERGEAPDPREFLLQYPDCASELRDFLGAHEQMRRVAVPETVDLGGGGARTLPPSSGLDRPSRTPRSGQRFGDYELLEEIARGGMGVVFRARQVSLNRTVALKMILAGQLAGEDEVRRFQCEAQAAANLEHPNIVPIYEVGEIDGQHFFTMGLIQGQSLASRLREGAFSPRAAAAMVKKIAEAISFAHRRKVVHRDLKPANILLDDAGEPKITDFGLAKRMEDDSALTATGQILGTPAYMPPEQAAGKIHDVGEASDVYSLGAILFALLVGRPPFEAPTALDTLVQVLEGEPTLPSKINRGVPRQLEWVCLKCLEKRPQARYQSADELAEDLERFLQGEPVQARPADAWQRVRRWSRREPALAGHLAALLVTVLIVQFIYVVIGRDPVYHFRNVAILSAWAVAAMVLQRVVRLPGWQHAGAMAWAVADAAFATGLLVLQPPPTGPLLVIYPLLITASGLFFRVRLVFVMTAACGVGYLVLVANHPEEAVVPHHCVLFFASLGIIGGMVAAQVHRVRRLSEYYEKPPG